MDRILADERETEEDLARKMVGIQPSDQASIYVKLPNFVHVSNPPLGSHPSLRRTSSISWSSIERSTSKDTNGAPPTRARKNFSILRKGFFPRRARTTPSEAHREAMHEERRDRNRTRRAFRSDPLRIPSSSSSRTRTRALSFRRERSSHPRLSSPCMATPPFRGQRLSVTSM